MSRAEQFGPISPARAERWSHMETNEDQQWFRVLGLRLEELRDGYCRMRLPWSERLTQPSGVAHGGVISSVVDTVVVPAIGGGYDEAMRFVTVDLHLQFLGALRDQDAIAEGWVTQRGRTIVFCEAEVVAASGRLVARGSLVYKVSPPAP